MALAGCLRLLLFGLGVVADARLWHGHLSSVDGRPQHLLEHVLTPVPADSIDDSVLPDHFDWRSVNGRSFVTADVNQHIPTYCGSCWIHGTTAALNDRIKVGRRGSFPDVMLSRQALMNCVPGKNDTAPPGCGGGDAWMVHSYLLNQRVPDETCQPYEARTGTCDMQGVCRNCLPPSMTPPVDSNGGCWAVPNYVEYGVREHGLVSGENRMMKEILARGPIVCSFAADETFLFNYSQNAALHEGVYVDRRDTNKSEVDHDVSVSGWGVTPGGTKYWIIRNSWGTYWGDGGWFRLLRGENSKLIEEDCAWAVPDFDEVEVALDGKKAGDYVYGSVPASGASNRPFSTSWPGITLALGDRPAAGSLLLSDVKPLEGESSRDQDRYEMRSPHASSSESGADKTHSTIRAAVPLLVACCITLAASSVVLWRSRKLSSLGGWLPPEDSGALVSSESGGESSSSYVSFVHTSSGN